MKSNVRAVWLGAFAWSKSWLHYPYMNGSLLHFLDSQVIHLRRMTAFASTDALLFSCPTNLKIESFTDSNNSNSEWNSASTEALQNSLPTKIDLGIQRKPSEELFFSSHFNTDIFRTVSSYDTGIEQISKPPSLVIAG